MKSDSEIIYKVRQLEKEIMDGEENTRRSVK